MQTPKSFYEDGVTDEPNPVLEHDSHIRAYNKVRAPRTKERNFRAKRALGAFVAAATLYIVANPIVHRVEGYLYPRTDQKVQIEERPVNIDSSVSESFQPVTTEVQNYSPDKTKP